MTVYTFEHVPMEVGIILTTPPPMARLALAAALHGRLGEDALLPPEAELARRIGAHLTERARAATLQAIDEVQGDAQAQLDCVLPLFDKGVQALQRIRMHDLVEFRSLTRPPSSLLPVYHAICILMNWGSGGGQDGMQWFLAYKKLSRDGPAPLVDLLYNYDKDAITEEMFRSIGTLLYNLFVRNFACRITTSL
jgi:hypothetical protein